MSIIKNGELTEDSHSDFDFTKKAVYYDADGQAVADETNKHQLKKPVRIKNLEEMLDFSQHLD